ncbi:MAG: DUF899 domain-containing protein [Proteobacteria bacterium]|nr:MAG: DUF899 domain-containing protein [Pseudomonadota bacterium]
MDTQFFDKNLKPAKDLVKFRKPVFSNESEAYKKAREDLMQQEIEFRRFETALAAQRRALPPGPVVAASYRFKDENGNSCSLKDLFGEHTTLVAYFWMYGPKRARPCPMCTNTLGSMNGNGNDIKQRTAFKVIGRSPIERQIAFALERGWQGLDFVECENDDFAKDLGFLNKDGTENPGIMVFKREGDEVRLFYMVEMPKEAADPGQDPRVSPDLGTLWNVLDLTPEGRGKDWYPKLSYS